MIHADGNIRCFWAKASNKLYVEYHDHEWGVPNHDNTRWFEMLCLEGAQAGLTWESILNRREGYRRVFHSFHAEKVAQMTDAECAQLMQDEGIIRNRLKIHSVVTNAQAFLATQAEFGSFNAYIWPFVGGKPIHNHPRGREELRTTSPESDALSKDLKKRGFTFVGSTICYALMQATGLVIDHTTDCFKHTHGEC